MKVFLHAKALLGRKPWKEDLAKYYLLGICSLVINIVSKQVTVQILPFPNDWLVLNVGAQLL